MNDLSVAQSAIFAAFIIPVIFIFFRHLWTGFLGWIYLIAFCSLLIVGGALSLGNTVSAGGSIVSEVGLSPLLLATSGILHEARVYRLCKHSDKNEWIIVLVYHLLVASGIGLVAAGVSGEENSDETAAQLSTDHTLAVVGLAILVVCWALLILGAGISLLPTQQNRNGRTHATGTKLLYAVLIALPFLGIRLFYTVAALATRKAYLNPVTGSLTIRVLLNFLPPIIITLVYIAVGLSTRAESVEDRKRSGSSESESSRHRRRRRNSSSRAMHGKAEV